MALALTINTEYSSQRMTTETGASELGAMTQAELLTLAIAAVKSRNPALTRCFMPPLPSLVDLQSAKVALEQGEVTPTPIVTPPAPVVKSKAQIQAEMQQATALLTDDANLLDSLQPANQ